MGHFNLVGLIKLVSKALKIENLLKKFAHTSSNHFLILLLKQIAAPVLSIITIKRKEFVIYNLSCNKLLRYTLWYYGKGFVIARKGSYLDKALLALCCGFRFIYLKKLNINVKLYILGTFLILIWVKTFAKAAAAAAADDNDDVKVVFGNNADFLTFLKRLNGLPIELLIDTGGSCNLVKLEWF
ncbi:hypothetical protein GGTG_09011 [Gaeumannomyces tritici R3-111a-1]|uniref:Uncharacterized protein n=1 Tax=Gaeumannomyces tritici (strain R3-111a-1) TaxID=644352 RepID=J3P670_GAET3|nr:hypothetical protein GGTG_09011 [Gaeumannomyces tritici R3-111a-1]EJT72144.1 hypothetical protein GGTG_09011 [Gaeumannomyces tritici R3-111a-1]